MERDAGAATAEAVKPDPFWHDLEVSTDPEKPKVAEAYITVTGESGYASRENYNIELKDVSDKVVSKMTVKSAAGPLTGREEARKMVKSLRKDLEDGIHWL